MELSQVLQALRNADAAGDTEAAQRLAEIANDMIRQQQAKPAAPEAKPESGFMPALSSGIERFKGQAAALAGRAGLTDIDAAEAYYKAQEEKAGKIFQPTEKGWTEAPLTKIGELAGGSIPYMVAPAVAGVAGAIAAPGAAIAGLGAGTLGAFGAGATQFTGTNIARQMDTGKRLAETDIGAAALAAIPQAALDTFALRMIPGIKGLFGQAGQKLTNAEAKAIASQGMGKTLQDYALSTGKVMGAEGLTEASQQVFERLQAGLQLTDEEARQEYFDNFLGGAVLGGVLAPAGRFAERSGIQKQAKLADIQDRVKAAAEKAQAKVQPAEVEGEIAAEALEPALLQLPAPTPQPPAPPAPIVETTRPGAVVATSDTRTPASSQQFNLTRAMEEHDNLRKQFSDIEDQMVKATPDEFAKLHPVYVDTKTKMDQLGAQINTAGGVAASETDFETQASQTLKKLTKQFEDAKQKGDMEKANKAALAIKDVTADFDNRRKALAAKAEGQAKRGETRELFTEEPEQPAGEKLRYENYKKQPVSTGIAVTKEEAMGVGEKKPTKSEVISEEAIMGAQKKLDAANAALPALTKAKDQAGIDAKVKEINTLEAELDRLHIGRRPKFAEDDIFSKRNVMRTAINQGDFETVLEVAEPVTEEIRAERKQASEAQRTVRENLTKSLDERLNLAGTKRTRIADEDTYQRTMDEIEALARHVEFPQGNAKKSVLQMLQDITDEHARLSARLESGVAEPTLREKTAALQAKLGKGEAPATNRQMDASERHNVRRKLDSLVKRYNALETSKVAPYREKIYSLYNGMFKTEPAQTSDQLKAAKAAESERQVASTRKTGTPKEGNKGVGAVVSKATKTVTRIRSGDFRKEAMKTVELSQLARELGEKTPEYQAYAADTAKRLSKLIDKYGKDDKAVNAYRIEITSERPIKAEELGRKSPEYKKALDEQAKKLKEAVKGTGLLEIPSKRTPQVTRKATGAPGQFRTSTAESKAETEQRVQRYNRLKGIKRDFDEGIASERELPARGVEGVTPDLTENQVTALENNDVRKALNDMAKDPRTSKLNSIVATRLAGLLDTTEIVLKDTLVDNEGNEVLGAANIKRNRITLNRDGGLSQEVLLHEGTHIGAERVIMQYETDPSKLTELQRVAVRELMAIHAAVKNDPRITSTNAKGSLSEFVAEIMSNRVLQEQMRTKAWRMSDAWNGFKSVILRMLGIEKPETMLGVAIQSVDAIFVPASAKVEVKPSGQRKLAQKDIAALHTGSNSMKQFAEQFGPDIKQKDRTVQDAERIGTEYMDKMYNEPYDYVQRADPDKLDYTSATIMSDGKKFDPDNALHYVEADAAVFANLKAQEDWDLRDREATQINAQRKKDLKSLIKNLMDEPSYTTVEQALVARAAAKYAVLSDKEGRLKLASIEANNRHNIAVVSAEDAGHVIQELRAGKGLKQAFLDGMQKNADENAKKNGNKNGWQKFNQVTGKRELNTDIPAEPGRARLKYKPVESLEQAAAALNAGAAGTPWCTGASVSTARGQIERGDFYIYYQNGKPEVAVRMDGSNKIGEIRGNSPNQALSKPQQEIAFNFLNSNNFEGTNTYTSEFAKKQLLIDVLSNKRELTPQELASSADWALVSNNSLSEYKVKNLFSFRTVDGYGGRPAASDKVIKELTDKLNSAYTNAYEQNYFVGASISLRPAESDTVHKFKFNGQEYTASQNEIKAIGTVGISSWKTIDEFTTLPALEYVNKIDMFNATKLSLPLIKNVNELTVFSAVDDNGKPLQAEVALANGSVVRNAQAWGNDPAHVKITGAIQFIDVKKLGNAFRPLHLVAPDALYVNVQKNDGNIVSLAHVLAANLQSAVKKKLKEAGLTRFNTDIPFEDLDPSTRKAAESFFKDAGKRIDSKFINDVYDRLGNESGTINAENVAEFFGLMATEKRGMFSRGEDLSLKDAMAVVAKFNDLFSSSDRIGTEEGRITAPKMIAEAPPVQALTETDDPIRYAPKPSAPGYEDALDTSNKIIASPKTIRQRVEANLGLAFRTQVLDRLAPLEKVANEMLEPLKGMQMMYYLRMYDQRMSYTQQAVGFGVPQRVAKKREDGRTEYLIESVEGPSLASVVGILKDTPNMNAEAANRLFTMYLLGKRAERVGYDKLNFKVSEAELRAVVKQIDGDEAVRDVFTKARNEYNAYNKGLMQLAIDCGAITPEEGARLSASNDYIPYYREQNGNAVLVIGGEGIVKIGNLREQPYLKELIGGEDKVLDFMTSSVQNTSMLIDMSLRNLAAKNAMYELVGLKLANFLGAPTAGKDIVTFKDKGVEKYVQVATKEIGIPSDLLVKGMEGIPLNNTGVVAAMGMPATFLRRAVTLSPLYAFRQLIRDSVAAPMLSGANFVPVMGAIKELGASATKTTLERRGITGGQIFVGTNEDLTKILRDLQSGKTVSWSSMISRAEGLSMEADAATRRAQYNSYLEQGLSEMEATLMSLESMNFNRRGVSSSVALASRLIPFFNAQLQSLDVLYRAFRGKMPMNERLEIQSKLLQRGSLMALTAVAYTLLMQDDETYKNANPDEKYGNFFVHVPGMDGALRIPVPFEIGYIFKGIPEALINTMRSEQGGEEAFKAFKSIALQTIPGGTSLLLPQAVKPFVENVSGYSFFTGRSLESAKEQMLEPAYRYRDNTTEIAKGLGKMFDVSPIKIENLVRGYTGGMGLAFLQALSVAVPVKGGTPEQASKRLSDMPVVGGLFQPEDAGGRINALYEHMKEARQVQKTFEDLIKDGRRAEAKEYMQKNINTLAQATMVGNVTQQMNMLNQTETAIKASDMDPAKKREELDKIRQIKIKFAASVREAFDKTKPQ
jgi:hypothetical protein